jgi:cytochrome bd-type quinol oxidase subunit 2
MRNKIINLLSGVYLAQGVQGSPIFKDLEKQFGNSGVSGSRTAGTLVTQVIQVLLLVGGSVAVIFFLIGAFQYITARGNEEAAEKAKGTITSSIFGLVLIIMAFAIIYVVSNALTGNVGI